MYRDGVRRRSAALVLTIATSGCFSLLLDPSDLPAGTESDTESDDVATDSGLAEDAPSQTDASDDAHDGVMPEAGADASAGCGPTDFCEDFEQGFSAWTGSKVDSPKATLELDRSKPRSGAQALRAVAGPSEVAGYVTREAWVEKRIRVDAVVRCTFWVRIDFPEKSTAKAIDFFHVAAKAEGIDEYRLHFGMEEGKNIAGFREDVIYTVGDPDLSRWDQTLIGGTFSGWTQVSFTLDPSKGIASASLSDSEGLRYANIDSEGGTPLSSIEWLAIRLGLRTSDKPGADVTLDDLHCTDVL